MIARMLILIAATLVLTGCIDAYTRQIHMIFQECDRQGKYTHIYKKLDLGKTIVYEAYCGEVKLVGDPNAFNIK